LITKKGKINNNLKIILDNNPFLLDAILDAVNFVDIDTKVNVRLKYIIDNKTEKHKCLICNKQIDDFSRVCCSPQCVAKNEGAIKKRKCTNKRRYGVEYAVKSKTVQDKIKETNRERYGVDNPLSSKEIRDRIEKTNKERYGSYSPFSDKNVQKKSQKSIFQKYGVENGFQSYEIKEKIKETSRERYGVEHPFQNKEIQMKMKRTMLERYGNESYSATHNGKERIRLGNISNFGADNYSRRHKELDFWKRASERTFWERFVDRNMSINETSLALKVSPSYVQKQFQRYNLPPPISFVSKEEKEILNEILNIKNDVELIQQDRKVINPYELDIFLPDNNLAIEYNGTYWHSRKERWYHQEKTLKCHEKNISCLQIYEYEWKENKNKIVKLIESIITESFDIDLYLNEFTFLEEDNLFVPLDKWYSSVNENLGLNPMMITSPIKIRGVYNSGYIVYNVQ
jgi:hypothetical protein